ncbi:MAG: methyltransferase domain-containing protein [Woeseiaceae bacterium]|nr:methyltransferase domain-containing protein [Woeseiaceae bacterium]
MKLAIDVPTAHTISWLRQELGPTPRRILEVGCGRGDVAAALVREGHDVVAIDSDSDCIEYARSLGVTAHVAEFPLVGPEIGDRPFGTVLFTRVLHHIEQLAPACKRAESLLVADGTVLLEDFAWESVNGTTAAWIIGMLRVGRALGIVPADEWNWDAEPLDGWRQPYIEHGLHAGKAMLQALADHLVIESSTGAPYAYRWFARYLEDHENGYDTTQAVLDAEAQLIGAGAIVPIGLRAVARKRSQGEN